MARIALHTRSKRKAAGDHVDHDTTPVLRKLGIPTNYVGWRLRCLTGQYSPVVKTRTKTASLPWDHLVAMIAESAQSSTETHTWKRDTATAYEG
jgi:hypothetical protein